MRGNSLPCISPRSLGHAREQGEGGARLEFEGQGQAVVETIELGRGSLVFEAFLLAQLWLICQSSRPSINRTSNSRPALAAGRSGTVSGSPAGGGDGVSEGSTLTGIPGEV